MARHIGTPGELPLFAAAGVEVEPCPAPPKAKRAPKPKPPAPAEQAAAARAQGARRPACACTDTGRRRIGSARNLASGQVMAFPLTRNTRILQETIDRLPHGYAPDLDRKRDQEVRRLQKELMERGVPKQSAWRCARELVHVAYIQRVRDAHKEAGIL